MQSTNHSRYMVKSLVHASRVLEAFQSAGDVLWLRDVVTRTGYNKGMCFRLIYTLHQCGFLDKVGENHYRLASEMRRRRLYRIGYAAQGQDASFDKEVRLGLVFPDFKMSGYRCEMKLTLKFLNLCYCGFHARSPRREFLLEYLFQQKAVLP